MEMKLAIEEGEEGRRRREEEEDRVKTHYPSVDRERERVTERPHTSLT